MTTLIQKSIAQKLLDAVAASVGNGVAFALPTIATELTWQTSFGTAPDSITLQLQSSNDGITWSTIDSSTSVTSVSRSIVSSGIFIRARINAIVGGTTVTVNLVAKPGLLGIVTPPSVTSGSLVTYNGTSGNVFGELVFDGDNTHVLLGDGTFGPSPGGGGGILDNLEVLGDGEQDWDGYDVIASLIATNGGSQLVLGPNGSKTHFTVFTVAANGQFTIDTDETGSAGYLRWNVAGYWETGQLHTNKLTGELTGSLINDDLIISNSTIGTSSADNSGVVFAAWDTGNAQYRYFAQLGSGALPKFILGLDPVFPVMLKEVFIPNGSALKTDLQDLSMAFFQAYDVDGVTYLTFATLANGNIPDFTIAPPSGGTVNIKATTYKSSDDSLGITAGPFTTITAIEVKNGLVTTLTGF